MQPGAHCLLHKPCSRCGQTKYYLQFPTKGSRRSRNGARKKYLPQVCEKESKAEAFGYRSAWREGADACRCCGNDGDAGETVSPSCSASFKQRRRGKAASAGPAGHHPDERKKQ